MTRLQVEPEDAATGRYDWAPSVMRDGERYRMWWVRLGGANHSRFPYATTLPDGERFEFTYPDYGDRIYYAESRDGRRWNLTGPDFTGPASAYGPDSPSPLMVLGPAESDQERNHIGCPSVIQVDGVFYMYYESCSDYVCRRQPDGRVAVLREYHNQVFVATSPDGRTWRRHPHHERPEPILRAPHENRSPGRQRYGFGQPSVFRRGGRFVMHYVDSCTSAGDCIVRIEADNPFFRGARPYRRCLLPTRGPQPVPAGAVARFAQTDVKYWGDLFVAVRPAYGTGNLGLLASRSGVFEADADARLPGDVFPQIRVRDPRGEAYRERLFPRFLTGPEGEILVEDGFAVVFYSSGRGFKESAYTWDLCRAEVPASDLDASLGIGH